MLGLINIGNLGHPRKLERKMKTYRVSWRKGRRIGAIGMDYPDSVIVQANSPYDAHMKAYDTHEHLIFVTVTEMDESNVSHYT